MTQSGKHGIFDGMLWKLLKMFTTNFKFLETSQNSLRIILVRFENHQNKASHKMTQYGKHGAFHGIFSKVSKLITTVSNGQNIPLHVSEDPVFSRWRPTSLIMIPKILQLMEGYILNIWNSLVSVLRFLKKSCGMFRRRFRVFQIVSY